MKNKFCKQIIADIFYFMYCFLVFISSCHSSSQKLESSLALPPVSLNAPAGVTSELLELEYDEFLDQPQESKLKVILAKLRTMDRRDATGWVLSMYEKDGFLKLEKMIAEKKTLALTFLMEIYPYTDGEFALVASINMGKALYEMPESFLLIMKSHDVGDYFLGKIVTGLDPMEFTDEPKKKIEELRRRKKRLQTVTKSDLVTIRNRCLRFINDGIATLAGNY